MANEQDAAISQTSAVCITYTSWNIQKHAILPKTSMQTEISNWSQRTYSISLKKNLFKNTVEHKKVLQIRKTEQLKPKINWN